MSYLCTYFHSFYFMLFLHVEEKQFLDVFKGTLKLKDAIQYNTIAVMKIRKLVYMMFISRLTKNEYPDIHLFCNIDTIGSPFKKHVLKTEILYTVYLNTLVQPCVTP